MEVETFIVSINNAARVAYDTWHCVITLGTSPKLIVLSKFRLL